MPDSWWQSVINRFSRQLPAEPETGSRLPSGRIEEEVGISQGAATRSTLEQRSAAAVMRIKNLELRAKVIVEGLMSGLHRSPYHGFSVEFTDYRPYSPGDDLRYLDWKLLARGDRQYIKRFEDETNARCHLLLDLSGSMGYGGAIVNSVGSSSRKQKPQWNKADYAKTLIAAITWFLHGQRDAVGVTLFQDRIIEQIPARFRPGQMRRIIAALDRAQPVAATNVTAPLDQLLRAVSKRGLIFLVSDLLTEIETWRPGLSYLRSQGHDMVVLRVLDPSELDFEFQDPLYFHDLETHREIYIDPQAAAADYRRRFQNHAADIKTCCDQAGVELLTITTDQPLEDALLQIIQRPALQGSRRFERGVGGQPAKSVTTRSGT